MMLSVGTAGCRPPVNRISSLLSANRLLENKTDSLHLHAFLSVAVILIPFLLVKHGVVTSFSPSCCLDHQMAMFERARVDVFVQNQRNPEDFLFSLNQSLSPNPPSIIIVIVIIYITVETGQ